MSDNSYNNWPLMNDVAIQEALGLYIKKQRQQQNKTQSELAKAAGISRSTLSLMERGETVTVATLIQVLRVLRRLDIFSIFDIQEQVSPLAMAKMEQYKRTRVRKKKTPHTTPRKSDW